MRQITAFVKNCNLFSSSLAKFDLTFGSKSYSSWTITIFASGHILENGIENGKDNEYSDTVVD